MSSARGKCCHGGRSTSLLTGTRRSVYLTRAVAWSWEQKACASGRTVDTPTPAPSTS